MPTPDNKRENCSCEPNDNVNFPCNCKCHKRDCKCKYDEKDNHCVICEFKETCFCHNNSQPSDPFTEKTLAEFDEKFPANFVECDGKNNITRESSLPHDLRDIKSFLRSALNAQREEIRRTVMYELAKLVIPNKDLVRILALLSPNNKENE